MPFSEKAERVCHEDTTLGLTDKTKELTCFSLPILKFRVLVNGRTTDTHRVSSVARPSGRAEKLDEPPRTPAWPFFPCDRSSRSIQFCERLRRPVWLR